MERENSNLKCGATVQRATGKVVSIQPHFQRIYAYHCIVVSSFLAAVANGSDISLAGADEAHWAEDILPALAGRKRDGASGVGTDAVMECVINSADGVDGTRPCSI